MKNVFLLAKSLFNLSNNILISHRIVLTLGLIVYINQLHTYEPTSEVENEV
ncbi:hypothetical protein SAMN05444354_101720 [Stigmatella aurantiaca]|uniref:Uncharacterized protein n=1 Tax=Stigmatella aurantiaca TaxID=41 RepID=A0A1H7HNL9_STIAU|nr:hypothetical protein SAMN05444354_101720 [Stigmatella aurantiaca]